MVRPLFSFNLQCVHKYFSTVCFNEIHRPVRVILRNTSKDLLTTRLKARERTEACLSPACAMSSLWCAVLVWVRAQTHQRYSHVRLATTTRVSFTNLFTHLTAFTQSSYVP